MKAFRDGKDVKIRTNFEGRPDIKISVRPTNPYQVCVCAVTSLGDLNNNHFLFHCIQQSIFSFLIVYFSRPKYVNVENKKFQVVQDKIFSIYSSNQTLSLFVILNLSYSSISIRQRSLKCQIPRKDPLF